MARCRVEVVSCRSCDAWGGGRNSEGTGLEGLEFDGRSKWKGGEGNVIGWAANPGDEGSRAIGLGKRADSRPRFHLRWRGCRHRPWVQLWSVILLARKWRVAAAGGGDIKREMTTPYDGTSL